MPNDHLEDLRERGRPLHEVFSAENAEPHEQWQAGLREEMHLHTARIYEIVPGADSDEEVDRLMNRCAFIRAMLCVEAPSQTFTHAAAPEQAQRETDDARSAISRAASLMGRKGGLRGGPARAAALSPDRRREIARNAGLASQAGRRAAAGLPPEPIAAT